MAGTRANKTSFKKGHKGGPGRPPKKAEQTALEQFKKTFNATNIGKILNVLLDKAVEGEPWAIRMVMDRMLPEMYTAQKMTDGEAGENPVVDAFRKLVENRKGE